MSSKYQMYLKHDSKFRFPVLPEKIQVTSTSGNDKIRVYGVGEVTIIQDDNAKVIEFSSFFPDSYFPGCNVSSPPKPKRCVARIKEMQASQKPVRFTLTNKAQISLYCTIESFKYHEVGGDVGTIYYTLKLKEYRAVTVRQITIDLSGATADDDANRVDGTPAAQTYTVKKGDCLWNIAKKFYGSGAKYTVIYKANKSVIGGNPNRIYPGQVYTIPAA
jgi:LysM domain.